MAMARSSRIAKERDTLRAENARLREALEMWRSAYETRQNEPLVIAYESTAALAKTGEKP